MNGRQIFGIAVMVITILGGMVVGPKLVENVDASEIILFQYPSGTLDWKTQPGITLQWFAKVTTYRKAGQIKFSAEKKTDDKGNTWWEPTTDQRIKIQFNDAGTGMIKGSINYELPIDPAQLTAIHSFYPTQEILESNLIKPALNKSIYLTGPLMSSKESYAERRTQMIQFVEDQTQNGVYLTQTVSIDVPDEGVPQTLGADGKPLPQPTKRVTVAEIQMENNQFKRAEQGQLARFHIRAFNFAIEDLDYEQKVDDQIAQQQQITMAVQTSIAEAKRAQQDAITAKARGEANIAVTRAEQEVEKTKAVVQAEKTLAVARLSADTAEQYKREQLTKADADSEYRRRTLAADGALGLKLTAIQNIHSTWANALANMKTPLVPGVVMGGNGNSGASSVAGVQTMMDLLTVKAARDLGVDLQIKQ